MPPTPTADDLLFSSDAQQHPRPSQQFLSTAVARQDLRGKAEDGSELTTLTPEGRRAVWGMALAAVVLISASLLGVNLGLPTFAAAVIAIAVAAPVNRKAVIAIVGSVSWSVLPMVAGLFILVEALNAAGALRDIGAAMRMCTQLSPLTGSLSASFGVALLSNVMNNLASGMLTGSAMQTGAFPNYIQHALLIGHRRRSRPESFCDWIARDHPLAHRRAP